MAMTSEEGMAEAKRRIAAWKENKIDWNELYLNNLNLEEIPFELSFLDNIKRLHLQNNQISNFTIHGRMDFFRDLRELDLSGNNLTSLPETLNFLKKLEFLDLSFNKITNVKNNSLRLKYLKYLNLKGNNLKDLHINITKIYSLINNDEDMGLHIAFNPLPPEVLVNSNSPNPERTQKIFDWIKQQHEPNLQNVPPQTLASYSFNVIDEKLLALKQPQINIAPLDDFALWQSATYKKLTQLSDKYSKTNHNALFEALKALEMETKGVINPFSYAQTLDDFTITLQDYAKNSPDLPSLDETPLKQLQKFEETLQAGLNKFPEVKKFHDEEVNKPPPSQKNIEVATAKLEELSALTNAAPQTFDQSIPELVNEITNKLEKGHITNFEAQAFGNTINNLASGAVQNITINYNPAAPPQKDSFIKKMMEKAATALAGKAGKWALDNITTIGLFFLTTISGILTALGIPHQWLTNFITWLTSVPV